jgi:ABC-2 type transport system permease protein
MNALAAVGGNGFWRRVGAMLLKEFLQLRRDRVTLATMISIPLLQLTLFGYAINTTPRHLPTAVLLQESSDVGRSILAALQNTKYFKVTRQLRDEAELDEALASGSVLFAVEIPANFERALRRGDDPALLIAADRIRRASLLERSALFPNRKDAVRHQLRGFVNCRFRQYPH